MIRLMLVSYTREEREALAEYLELAQRDLEVVTGCRDGNRHACRTCRMRHLCTDLLSASVYAKDFMEPTK